LGGRTARIATPKPSSGAEPGVHAFAKALGHEFGPFGVTANVVAPGWIDTERDWSQYPTSRSEKEIRRIPVRRIGTVTDIAAACVYLASASAGFINGQVIHANGGRYWRATQMSAHRGGPEVIGTAAVRRD